jgi:glycosyltransferase involved in cell wall biosynthesis
MIRVGLNLLFLIPGETGGMETAARAVIPHLLAQPDLHVTAFVNREAAGTLDGVEQVVVPVNATNRVEWVRGEQQYIPRLAARAGCDVVHSMGSTAPLWGDFRRVTTIHDLHYKLIPEAHFGIRDLGMRVLVPSAARRSSRIIAVSEATRRDLQQHLKVPAAKVDVVPQGVSMPERVDRRPEGIVLCVGAKRPHKNALAVVEALVGSDLRLVVTGYRTAYDDVLRDRAHALGVKLELPDWVDDLDDLYARADVVVVPSLYEGFGLPVLEAMARGVPVVASNRSSLPEVAGDAAVLVDPEDRQALRGAIEQAIHESDRLSRAGRERAGHFTWERTAQLTVETYRRAL